MFNNGQISELLHEARHDSQVTRVACRVHALTNGWTWEHFRDAANRSSTTALLRKFVELFVNGLLTKAL